jgi:His-Xaa-Ser system protein HxsD
MNKIAFSLNSKIVSLEAIYSTCYSFIDKFYIYLDKNKENIIVSLQPKEKETKINPKAIEGEFRNELLNNLLREKIAKNNAKIREYILGQALYSSMPSEVEEFLSKTSEDYLEDPLGIAVPWEEKIKSKNKATKKKSKSK